MRNRLKVVATVAIALLAAGVHAVTGETAAQYVTSDATTVGYEAPDGYTASFDYIGTDGGVYNFEYPITYDTCQYDVEQMFQSLSKYTAKESMINAMKALAYTQILFEQDYHLGKRIDALEDSANTAFANVNNKVNVVDEHGNKIETLFQLVQSQGGGGDGGGQDVSITTAGVPVDGTSIDYTGTPTDPSKPAPLEVKGFSSARGIDWKIPHSKGNVLAWDSLMQLLDLKTIDSKADATRAFGLTFGLKGWDSPGTGSGKCDDTLSSQLVTGDESHLVLTRLNDGKLHYTPVGRLSLMSPDMKSVTTNETADGSLSVKGAANATQNKIAWADGDGGITFEYAPPKVEWDADTDTLKITDFEADDEQIMVNLPHIGVTTNETEDATEYTVTWRNLNETEDTVTVVSVPKPVPARTDATTVVTNATGHANEAALAGFWDSATKDGMFPVKSGNALVWVTTNAQGAASAALDETTIITNAPGHAGEIALKGFWDSGTKNGAFPVKNGDTLVWVQTNAQDSVSVAVDGTTVVTNATGHANEIALKGFWNTDTQDGMCPVKSGNALVWVPTNRVDCDDITIALSNGKLGLKGWNPNYGGNFPLFLVNAGGVIDYYPLPEAITNNAAQCDITSLATNDENRLEIKGWKSQNGCNTDAATILEGTDTENHQIVARVGGANGSIHYLPFGKFPHPSTAEFTVNNSTKEFTIKGVEGKFLRGTAQGGVEWVTVDDPLEVDGESIVTNDTGKAHISGYGTAANYGKFLKHGDSGGVEWADPPTNGVDNASIVLADGNATLNGFSVAGPNMMPYKGESGKLEWTPPPSVAVDDASVVTNAAEEITLNGFAIAGENTIPHKENGVLVWGGISAVTNTILAGAGINITDNGGGAITISAQALTQESGGSASGSVISLSVVTDVRYDAATHKFQCKRRTIVCTGSLGTESGWEDVFEATSHQGEHYSGGGSQ